MASLADLVRDQRNTRQGRFMTKLNNQNFGKNDSTLVSAIRHPIDALGRGADWFQNQVNTAAGTTGDNYDPYLQRDAQIEAAVNLAGLANVGSMPFAPKSSGGTLGTVIKPTEYELAHETARINAAKPISEGGLGLPENNTAMDRARALGFDVNQKWLHGSAKRGYVDATDIESFDSAKIGDSYNADDAGFFMTNSPKEANYYASSDRDYHNKGEGNGVVYPLIIRHEKPLIKKIPKNTDTVNYWDDNSQKILKDVAKKNSDAVILTDTTNGQKMGVAFEPSQIRSINAAFDPLKKNSANLLASLLAATVATKEAKDQKKKRSLADQIKGKK